MRAPIVALTGPSATGKSTTATALAGRRGWVRLDEAYDRLRPTPALTWANEAGLRRLEFRLVREEARRYAEARQRSAQGQAVVADTAFLDPVVYTAGLCLLGLADPATYRAVSGLARALARKGRLGLPDLTVRLRVSPRTRAQRAARDPEHHPPALRARHEAVGRLVRQMLERPLHRGTEARRGPTVRATGSPQAVARRIAALARRSRPRGDPAAVLERTVRALDRVVAAGNLKKATPSRRAPR